MTRPNEQTMADVMSGQPVDVDLDGVRAYDWANGKKVSYTGTDADSVALAAGEYCLSPTTNCFVTMALATPSAGPAAGSLPIPAFACFHVWLPEGAILSVEQVSEAGDLYIMPVA